MSDWRSPRKQSRSRIASRLAALTGLAVLASVGATTVGLVRAEGPEMRFEPAAFRSAAVRGDHDELRVQAQAAVAQQALIGMSAQQLHRALGKPARVYRNTSRLAWQVDDWTTSGAPGAKLVVSLDRTSMRAVAGHLEPPR